MARGGTRFASFSFSFSFSIRPRYEQVENENDYENEKDWSSGVRVLRFGVSGKIPLIAFPVEPHPACR
jgi:hypothetical protein